MNFMTKKRNWMFGFAALGLTAGALAFPAIAKAADGTTEVKVHYFRYDHDYSNWNLWMWPYAPANQDGAEYDFTGTDANGWETTDAQVPGDDTQVGVIVRLGDWQAKDIDENRYIDTSNGSAEIWLVEGDPNIYTSEAAAEAAAAPHITNAFLDGDKTILAKLSTPIDVSSSAASSFSVTDATTGQTIPVTNVQDANTPLDAVVVGDFAGAVGGNNWDPTSQKTAMHEVNPDLYQYTVSIPAGSYQYKVAMNGGWSEAYPANNVTLAVPTGGADVTFSYVPSTHSVYDSINNKDQVLPTSGGSNLVTLTLASAPDVTDQLTLSATGYTTHSILPRNVLDDAAYTYTGDDLGSTYERGWTNFRVWAPTATHMNLQLFNTATGPVTLTRPMQKGTSGTWVLRVPGNLKNWYYLYQVTVEGQTTTAVDPYAKAIAVNGTRAMVVDPDDVNPPGWQFDRHVGPQNPEDAVIYEAHVRDFSIDANSGMTHKGQYLAFTENNTHGPDGVSTGVASLKQLGITDIQLQPTEEFNSIDETQPNQYNWGYDPRNFDVPEGAYATTPVGTARIDEFKDMVENLHDNHIGVVMDVVYNHLFDAKQSDFDKLVPGYYFRTDSDGNLTNGSGVGNEFASERPMAQKFILDSVKYWVNEYHVDGFRFDLMALLGIDTMKKVSQELHAIDPKILLYGEPWTGGTSGLPSDQLLEKGQQQGLGVGVFNDNIRNALDGSVFDASAQGFATGATGDVGAIENGVVGSIDYNSDIHDFAASPSETINYVTSHDNMTLWDKIAASNSTDSLADRTSMDELAQAVVFTSQGVPFMQGGEEMLRTKGGNNNSYNAGDAVNEFDWSLKAKNIDVFNYYAGMIHLREAHPAFRMTTTQMIQQHLSFLPSPDNTVAYELTNHANGDRWKNIVVVYNPNKTDEALTLPSGSWNVAATKGTVLNGPSGAPVSGQVSVPAISCEILYQN